jgi:tripartite-type tricarboxylate transporter receptor subunit TctC
MRKLLALIAIMAAILASESRLAAGADYPVRPVQLVVGLTAGGGTDLVARLLADWISQDLGQKVVVENRAGMGGNLAAQSVINAAADGYTLLFVGPNNAIAQSLYKKLPFNFLRDTTPVAGVMRLTNLMVVPPSLPVHNVKDFIDYAKAHPGKLSMGSTGHGTSVHLSGELFKAMTKTDMVHVPYRGASVVYPDLMNGNVHVLFGNLTSALEFARSGRLRALVITAAKRWKELPDMPTIAETVPGYEADVWYGVVAPKGTSADIVARLNKSINAALADPKLVARFVEAGGEPMPMSSGEFGKMLSDETEKWRGVVEFAGISVE